MSDGVDIDAIHRKVAHVKAARQTRLHVCHWPGCTEQVPPAKWGCRRHWFALPNSIRIRIWDAYVVGQEDRTALLSAEYVAAAQEAQRWIANHIRKCDECGATGGMHDCNCKQATPQTRIIGPGE